MWHAPARHQFVWMHIESDAPVTYDALMKDKRLHFRAALLVDIDWIKYCRVIGRIMRSNFSLHWPSNLSKLDRQPFDRKESLFSPTF